MWCCQRVCPSLPTAAHAVMRTRGGIHTYGYTGHLAADHPSALAYNRLGEGPPVVGQPRALYNTRVLQHEPCCTMHTIVQHAGALYNGSVLKRGRVLHNTRVVITRQRVAPHAPAIHMVRSGVCAALVIRFLCILRVLAVFKALVHI